MDFLASRRTVVGSKVDEITIVLLHAKNKEVYLSSNHSFIE